MYCIGTFYFQTFTHYSPDLGKNIKDTNMGGTMGEKYQSATNNIHPWKKSPNRSANRDLDSDQYEMDPQHCFIGCIFSTISLCFFYAETSIILFKVFRLRPKNWTFLGRSCCRLWTSSWRMLDGGVKLYTYICKKLCRYGCWVGPRLNFGRIWSAWFE